MEFHRSIGGYINGVYSEVSLVSGCLAVAVTMYNDSDSDFVFALTQNKFRESPSSGEYNTDNAISDLLGEPMPNLFTFQELNYALESFEFAAADKGNKPGSIILLARGTARLKCTQSQMWCFVRIMPFLLGHLIPIGNPHWDLFLSLLDMIEWICAPAITTGGIGYMRGVIEDCLDLFRELYPEQNTKPKTHYITHYPTQTHKFGPLTRCWTIRLEGKHVFFKGIFQRTKNIKNICKTLAERHQCKQALLHTSDSFLSTQKIEMTGASNECTIFLPRGVQFLVEQLSESELIAIGSFSYWVACCVVFDHDNEIYSFGEVAYIFQCKGDYFLCCKRMAVVEYRHRPHEVMQMPKLKKNSI